MVNHFLHCFFSFFLLNCLHLLLPAACCLLLFFTNAAAVAAAVADISSIFPPLLSFLPYFFFSFLPRL